LSWSWRSIKTVIVASSWCSIFTLSTLIMHGQTQIKFTAVSIIIKNFIFCWPCKFLLITKLMHFFMYIFIYFPSLHVSSITVLIIRRLNCINTSNGMISVCEWLLGMLVYRHTKQSHRLIIPDDVLIQFDLLMMSTVMLETCREMKWINRYKKNCISLIINKNLLSY
jgi:hypothetical protein